MPTDSKDSRGKCISVVCVTAGSATLGVLQPWGLTSCGGCMVGSLMGLVGAMTCFAATQAASYLCVAVHERDDLDVDDNNGVPTQEANRIILVPNNPNILSRLGMTRSTKRIYADALDNQINQGNISLQEAEGEYRKAILENLASQVKEKDQGNGVSYDKIDRDIGTPRTSINNSSHSDSSYASEEGKKSDYGKNSYEPKKKKKGSNVINLKDSGYVHPSKGPGGKDQGR